MRVSTPVKITAILAAGAGVFLIGLYFLFLPQKSKKEDWCGADSFSVSKFYLTALTAERSGDHIHLIVTVHIRNPFPTPLRLDPPTAQLWIGSKNRALPFLAPGLEPPVIGPGAESEAATHWWIGASEFAGPLELKIADTRQPVKSMSAFSFDSLPENKPIAIPLP